MDSHANSLSFLRSVQISCLAVVAGSCFSFAASAGVHIQFDYTYDSTGFFSGINEQRRVTLEAAARVFEGRITDTFPAIDPTGVGTWSVWFPNPSTGEKVVVNDPIIEASTIFIYVGARAMPKEINGKGAPFAWSSSGQSSFVAALRARHTSSNFDSFGGEISFSLAPN